MDYGRILGRYQKTEVATAGKLDLVIMCYDKTIQLIKQAEGFYEEKLYEKKGRALQRALNIISELQGSLDLKKGGQIAANLNAIYAYVSNTLINADVRKNPKGFDEAARLMSELKEAWEGIASLGNPATNPESIPKGVRSTPNQIAA